MNKGFHTLIRMSHASIYRHFCRDLSVVIALQCHVLSIDCPILFNVIYFVKRYLFL